MLNRTVERDLVLSIGDALQALDEADAAHTAKAPVGSMPPDELFFAGAEAARRRRRPIRRLYRSVSFQL